MGRKKKGRKGIVAFHIRIKIAGGAADFASGIVLFVRNL